MHSGMGEAMGTQAKPPIIGTAVAAWEDAFRAIGSMPAVAGIALVIVIVLSLATFLIIPNPYTLLGSHWLPLFSVTSSIVYGVLLAPLAIVVHRYVLLGEVANRYPLDPFSARYVRFAAFAVLVKIVWLLPSYIENFMRDDEQDTALHAALGLVGFALLIAVVIVTVRRVILFPAIAIDAPGASWRNARNDTKGSSWRVALIMFCVAVPALIVILLLYYVLVGLEFGGPSVVLFSLVRSVVAIASLCAFAAAASHIYRARADALALPAS